MSKREKGNASKREPITYYECKKPDHIRIKCPFLKEKKKRNHPRRL